MLGVDRRLFRHASVECRHSIFEYQLYKYDSSLFQNRSSCDTHPRSPLSSKIANMMCLSSIVLLRLLGLSSGVLAAGAFAPTVPPRSPAASGKTCTLIPNGNNQDDVPQILEAFESCNNGGTVVFPENSTFFIATRLNPVIHDVTIDWRGTWLVRSGYHSPCKCDYRL